MKLRIASEQTKRRKREESSLWVGKSSQVNLVLWGNGEKRAWFTRCGGRVRGQAQLSARWRSQLQRGAPPRLSPRPDHISFALNLSPFSKQQVRNEMRWTNQNMLYIHNVYVTCLTNIVSILHEQYRRYKCWIIVIINSLSLTYKIFI